MEKTKKIKILVIIINILIVILEVIGFVITIKKGGYGIIKFYTEDTNFLALISSLVFVIYIIIKIKCNRKNIRTWLKSLKYL